MHGSVLAYSGSMGNAVRITNNHIYGNTAGISTDTISAGGHPGFPADSVQVDHNYIYSNNLDLFGPNPPVEPVVGSCPPASGIFWAGHNNGRVHDNWIWDNWRGGALAALDPRLPRHARGQRQPGRLVHRRRNPTLSTSCGNRYYDNQLGRVPTGFRPFPRAHKFGNNVAPTRGVAPNGVDFWWDEGGLGPCGNCWYNNVGSDGTPPSVTGPGSGDGNDTLPADWARARAAATA